jgi:hypothetical protein
MDASLTHAEGFEDSRITGVENSGGVKISQGDKSKGLVDMGVRCC